MIISWDPTGTQKRYEEFRETMGTNIFMGNDLTDRNNSALVHDLRHVLMKAGVKADSHSSMEPTMASCLVGCAAAFVSSETPCW